jgi:hypothetical protein
MPLWLIANNKLNSLPIKLNNYSQIYKNQKEISQKEI